MIYIVALCLASMNVEILKLEKGVQVHSEKLRKVKPLKAFNTEAEAQNFRQMIIQTHENLKLKEK